MFIDVKKADENPKCEEDAFLDLPEECHCPPRYCGKLNLWMYGMRQVDAAWERHYAEKLSSIGFRRRVSCGERSKTD
eukprot:7664584-Karenia_brevis.AAC.1